MTKKPQLTVYTRPGKRGVGFYIQGWYEFNGQPQHFNKRAVNPDDLSEVASDERQANYFASKWEELIGKGGNPRQLFTERKKAKTLDLPKNVTEFLDRHWPKAKQEYRYPERWPGAMWARVKRDFGTKTFAEVTPLVGRGWLRDLRAEGLAVATVNRHKEAAQVLWDWAIGEGLAQVNPWPQVKKLKGAPETAKRILMPVEEEKLITACRSEKGQGKREYVEAALVILVETGMRPESEFFAMRKIQVDLGAKVVTVISHKGRGGSEKRRRIPISVRALPYFERLMQTEGEKLYPHASIKKAWASICDEAKIGEFWLRWLRDTAINRWKAAGMHALDIALLAGHSRPDTTMIYAQPDLAHIRQRMDKPASAQVLEFPAIRAKTN